MNGAFAFHNTIYPDQLNMMSRDELLDLFEAMENTIMQLSSDLQTANTQLRILREQHELLLRMHFLPRSERSVSPGQMNMFGDPVKPAFLLNDEDAEEDEEEEQETAAPARKRKKKKSQGGNRFGAKVKVVEELIEEDDPTCPKCGSRMEKAGTEQIREEIVIHPPTVEIRRILRNVYKCAACAKQNDAQFLKPPVSPALFKNSPASIESIAWLFNEKFSKSLPLYRIENDLKNLDCLIPRSTLSNWIIMASERYFEPMWRVMREELLKQPVIHADETTFQVLHEDGRTAWQKSYMWGYCSGDWEKEIYVLFDYQPSRGFKCPEAFLGDFAGTLQCDGYDVYHKFKDRMLVCGCFSHVRRKWDKAVKVAGKKSTKDHPAKKGFAYCNQIFALERDCKEMSPEERLSFRKEFVKPVLDEFDDWVRKQTPSKTTFGNAVTHTLEQWPFLCGFLEDPLASASNNSLETLMRTIAVGRKNFLFANSERGGRAVAVGYSVVLTAKQNNLAPIAYLTWVLTEMRAAQPRRDEVAECAEAEIWRRRTLESRSGNELTEEEKAEIEAKLREFDEALARTLLPKNAPKECRLPDGTK